MPWGAAGHPCGVHRDTDGVIRVISTEAGYDRLVQPSFEKIRQVGSGMPAVVVPSAGGPGRIMERAPIDEQ